MPLNILKTPVLCKCCGSQSPFFTEVDFNRDYLAGPTGQFTPSGILIPYHRCSACGFIFTVAFDRFSTDDFHRHIYNADYARIDPDYKLARPTSNARDLAQLFAATRNISVLDYGGGNGLLAANLRSAGFSDASTYDPFVPEHSTRPQRKFDLIVCFEVAEHTTRPVATFSEMASLLNPAGLVMFTTMLQPDNIATLGTDWWYIAPRNGHVSLYSPASLHRLLQPHGLRLTSCNANLHLACNTAPSFAAHLLRS
jgi:2-polyprenyl-6-hydroxyphenyl methylase/3-demethylubiquinone-9 3-methyltransferase